MTDALRFEQVHRHFGRRAVLTDISFTVTPHGKTVLAGANGAGKTTLLRIAATVLRPTGGLVEVAGKPPGEGARHHLAYLPQTATVYDEFTPLEQVRWWARLHGHEGGLEDARARLAEAGLAAQAHRTAAVLSRGQRQRLALACAFATEAPLLLLDEPTNSLDRDGRAWLGRALADHPGAVVAATHEDILPEARVLHLDGGRLD